MPVSFKKFPQNLLLPSKTPLTCVLKMNNNFIELFYVEIGVFKLKLSF